mmetsp:Transcript_3611/g.6378  ORF Transcript_3611/g.6378 Transcript_3611/m.6378 type:complete len:254 (-) Transcript_3611:664-1425(-)
MAPARLSTLFDAVRGNHGSERFQSRGGCVNVRYIFLADRCGCNEFVFHGFQFFCQLASGEKGTIRKGKKREKPMLLLRVVQDLFFVLAILCKALFANRRVTNSNSAGHTESFGCTSHDHRPNLHHGNVRDFGCRVRHGFLPVFSVFVHTRESHGHVSARYRNVREIRESVVHVVVSDFGSYVARFHSGKQCVVLHGSQLDQEIMNPTVFSIAVDQLGNHHGMVRGPTQRSRPEFSTRQRRAIDDPGSSLLAPL